MARVVEESETGLVEAAEVLQGGGIVVVPSRTNYALICDAETPSAIDRVFDAKRRTKFGPLTLAVTSIASTAHYVTLPNWFNTNQLDEVWPDEVSFIFDIDYPFPKQMTMGANTVAVMRQRECALNRLLEVFGSPVALTSANLSGQGNMVVTREKAMQDLSEDVDLVVVNDRTDEVVDVSVEGLNPSNTIVDFTFDVPYLVRHGAVPPETLRPWVPNLVMDTDRYQAALSERLQASGS